MGGKTVSQKTDSLKLLMKKNNIPSIDLHGQEEDEVFNLIDQFIRKHKNQEQVLVIVGKGRGVVRKKVLEYLKLAHYPWNYERSGSIINEGALIVDLY